MTLLYLDTSALVKLYVPEPEQPQVVSLVEKHGRVVASVIAYTEARAVFSRKQAVGEFTADEYAQVVADFDEEWQGINEVDVTPLVYRRAADLTVSHPELRAMDALHLSSAIEARAHGAVKFLTFDHTLARVARQLLSAEEMA